MTGEATRLVGGYAQLGTFLSEWCAAVPRPLELVARVSLVDPGRSVERNTLREWTMGASWFVVGHRNKLTADVSWLNFDSQARDASLTRFRLQWELPI
ncbi:MAG: hypothetical protein AAGB00_09540 [Planctomycetota bacterium]